MPTSASEALLRITGLRAGYGKIAVLHGIDLSVGRGEAVGLLGSNGAGKTTLLKTITGLIRRSEGEVRFDGQEIGTLSTRSICNLGLAHVVDGHRVFTQLTVEDNLLLSAYDLARRERSARLREAFEVFPELEAKARDKAGSLSGGQRQMLCVAQGLVKRPRLIMLDEPSAGLSPILVDRILDVVASLKARGTAVLLVDQLIEKVVASCDRIYALNRGEISLEAAADEPGLAQRIEHTYFH